MIRCVLVFFQRYDNFLRIKTTLPEAL